ncbi:hypothetical protein COU80_03135 [Candidatus Peregrinibacteria bacterium CG10_big_fil_rev_8_21_14_0_10_55_24]|nr:MAG: hypothetical protein COU80_03135 [Candidatus Peregrinibacteria bacterium CG10_big_fil_rev_8_21_14_0_10_55_24]
MELLRIPSWKVGLAQAILVLSYVLLFALTLQTVHGWLGDNLFPNPFVGIAFFLTAFVFSALVCGSAVLGYPLVLLVENNVRRTIEIICWSAVWLAAFLGMVLIIAIGMSL